MKLMVPTEQALSMSMFAAQRDGRRQCRATEAAKSAAHPDAALKFRACRDNIPVATGRMEVRGGIGYIEEWVNARLVRDAQIGMLWEGTSNINALDVVQRAVGKAGGHKTLTAALKAKVEPSGLPGQYKGLLGATLDRVERFAEAVASDAKHEKRARLAAGALYHAASAALMAWEGATLGAKGGDARRLLLSRLVIEHRSGAAGPAVAQRGAVGAGSDGHAACKTRRCHWRKRSLFCLELGARHSSGASSIDHERHWSGAPPAKDQPSTISFASASGSLSIG